MRNLLDKLTQAVFSLDPSLPLTSNHNDTSVDLRIMVGPLPFTTEGQGPPLTDEEWGGTILDTVEEVEEYGEGDDNEEPA